MSVKIVDHVKREKVRLKPEATTSSHFIQPKEDDSKIVSDIERKNNDTTFTELSAVGMDVADGDMFPNVLVALQFEQNHFLMVSKPRSRHDVTLKIKMKETKYSEIFDEKRSKIPRKKKSFWFHLKTVEGYQVYESLASRGFYISVEGEKVQMRKVHGSLPSGRNFLISVMPALEKQFSSRIRSRTINLTAAMIPEAPLQPSGIETEGVLRALNPEVPCEPTDGDTEEAFPEINQNIRHETPNEAKIPHVEGTKVVATETDIIEEAFEVTEDDNDVSVISVRLAESGENDIEHKSRTQPDVVSATSEIVRRDARPEVTSESVLEKTDVVLKPHIELKDLPEVVNIEKQQKNISPEAPVDITTSEDNNLNENPNHGTKRHDRGIENNFVQEDISESGKREITSNSGTIKPVRKGFNRFLNFFSCVSSRTRD